jgi:ketosteroid isomerase-like protein
MSRENVEVIRRAIAAINLRDLDALLESCDPEIEFSSLLSALGTTFRGHEGMREYLREITDNYEEMHLEIERIEDRGEVVTAALHARGRGKASGVTLEWDIAYAARLRNGRGWRVASRSTEADALEAVALSE